MNGLGQKCTLLFHKYKNKGAFNYVKLWQIKDYFKDGK